MRFAIVFLVCVTPLAWGIRILGQDEPKATRFPEQLAIEEGDAVLFARDLLDERGETPFHGEILELKDIVLKMVEDGRVESYVAVRRLDRQEDKPRLEGVRCALFETEKGKQEDLRATIEAPFIAGDPAQWLRGDEEGPRYVKLGGGVVVRDHRGRQLVSIPSLEVDLVKKRIRSDERIEAGEPERGIELSGVGLDGDVIAGTVTLRSKVDARIPYAGEVLRIRCQGPATLTRHEGDDEGPDRIELILENGVRFNHPLLEARCRRIEAVVLLGGEGEATLESARLSGPIRADFDPRSTRGLEWLETDSLHIVGEQRIEVEGKFRGEVKGSVPSISGATVGLGERLFQLSGDHAWFEVRRTSGDTEGKKADLELVGAHFERGLEISEPEGIVSFNAPLLHVDLTDTSFEAPKGVEARSPEGSMRTENVSGRSEREGHLRLDFAGATEMTYLYVGKGRLGPLARAPEGRIEISCQRALSVDADKEKQTIAASGGIEAKLDDNVSLKCEQFTLSARKLKEGEEAEQAIEAFSATGGVKVTDRSLDTEVSGDSIIRQEGRTELVGSPALVSAGAGRSVSAKRLSYDDEGNFEASGTVRIVSPLDEEAGAGTWSIVCDRAEGRMPDEGPPTTVKAFGPIFAVGPDGLRIEGSLFEYEAKTSKALLTGNPARFRHGTDLDLDAAGFEIDVDLENGTARSAWTRGKARIQVNPKGEGKLVKGLADLDFHRLHALLAGPAHYDGKSLSVEKGGKLAAFDEQGVMLVEAEAGSLLVELEPIKGERMTARRVLGSGGVMVLSKGIRATADRLSYAPGSGLVNVEGNARASGAGFDADVTWERLTFIRVKDGIDLKSVRAIKVTPKQETKDPED